ncbi:MAG: PorP/SprF family type IX secretion system membrane protein [Salinivirgaceae bacterium]|nr:PorP/SprF family type IX secretion system membrane protein [Salinivirgaceae bacterium]MDY0279847.1 PorP/SprF family type IX secretion system membrane protein [Salinivirgaceae bacterium]
MKRLISLIFSIITFSLSAQVLPQSTFFVYDQMTINPGYAGSQEGICVNILARNQWMGFDGAPNTQKFDVHMPFKLFGAEHGAGFALYNDKIGLANDINATLSYSFLKGVGSGKIGIGGGVGFFSQTLSGSFEPINGNDAVIPNPSDKGKIAFTANIGAFYQAANVFLGLSIMNINEGDLATKTGDNKPYANMARQFNITGGYNYQLSNPLFEIQPAFLIRTTGSTTQISVNAALKYKGKIWGGVGYRNTDAITAFIGAEFIEGLNFGLAYDVTTSKIAKYDDGSVEIFLRYVFKIGIEREQSNYKSIRYL